MNSGLSKFEPLKPDIEADEVEPVALSIALVGATDPVLRAIGQSLAQGGADLVLIDTNADELTSTRTEIEAASEHSQVIVYVVKPDYSTSARDLLAMISSTCEYLDAVIVSIGNHSRPGNLSQFSPGDWHSALDASLIRLSLAVTSLSPALERGGSGTFVVLATDGSSQAKTKSGQLLDSIVERYVSAVSDELAADGFRVEMIRTSPEPSTLFGAITSRIVETIHEATMRRAEMAASVADQADDASRGSISEIEVGRADSERDVLREELGAMYRRRSNALQKKRELGNAWTPRFEAAYQGILGDIATLEKRMGLPPSQAATSLRPRSKS